MNILYKFPSRSRCHKFFKTLNNIHELSDLDTFSIMATLDIDDREMANEEVKQRLLDYPKVKAIYGTSKTKIEACNRDMEFSGEWDIVVLVSDDMEFLVKGFDRIIVEEMEKAFPDLDGILHFPDSHGKWELSVLSIIGRTYFERTGHFYNPEYDSQWADNEYTDVATILNKRHFVCRRIYDHMHHIWGKSQKDELNIRNDDMNLYVKDNQTYLRRKANNFGINIFQ
jgi:hypothetical protein